MIHFYFIFLSFIYFILFFLFFSYFFFILIFLLFILFFSVFRVEGGSAADVARNFIQRWNHHRPNYEYPILHMRNEWSFFFASFLP